MRAYQNRGPVARTMDPPWWELSLLFSNRGFFEMAGAGRVLELAKKVKSKANKFKVTTVL